MKKTMSPGLDSGPEGRDSGPRCVDMAKFTPQCWFRLNVLPFIRAQRQDVLIMIDKGARQHTPTLERTETETHLNLSAFRVKSGAVYLKVQTFDGSVK